MVERTLIIDLRSIGKRGLLETHFSYYYYLTIDKINNLINKMNKYKIYMTNQAWRFAVILLLLCSQG